MMNRTGQPTNEDLLNPKKEHWQVQTRNSFKLIVSVQCHNMTEDKIIKFQKQVEDLAAAKFQGGTISYVIE